MNKKLAEEAGYTFEGYYSKDKEEAKKRAKECRDKGNKAIVVTIPPDKLSRGRRGTGYSVYWIESEKNIQIREQRQKELLKGSLLFEKSQLEAKLAAINEKLKEFE